MTGRFEYREDYLQAFVARLRPLFGAIGVEIPVVRCSCSFPFRGGRRVIGQCFPGSMSDGIPQIKISPVLDDPVIVAATLVHELVHACRPGAGHGPPFRAIAIPLGLVGPMRSTTAGTELTTRLQAIASNLGPYPHAAINLGALQGTGPESEPRVADGPRRQVGRLIKVFCPEHGYPARVTRVWLKTLGPPSCPCGRQMVVAGAQSSLGPVDAMRLDGSEIRSPTGKALPGGEGR